MPREETATNIHPTAVVEDGVVIGAGTRIWHHAHVRAGARIGRSCTLGKDVFVDKAVSIGDSVKIQNNVSVYRGVELEDEVFVGPSVVFTNDRWPRATSTEWEVVRTTVRRGASIGANATLIAPLEVGDCALVAAGAVVIEPVLPHEMVAGNPARRIGWICRCGQTVDRTVGERQDITCESCGVTV